MSAIAPVYGVTPEFVSQLNSNFASLDAAQVPTLAALKVTPAAAPAVVVVGYKTTPADGWGGMFALDTTDTTTPGDDALVVVDDSGRRWKRVYEGPPSIEWWGVNAANSADVNAARAIQAVAAASAGDKALYWPAGTYETDGSIPLLHTVRHTGPGVIKRGSNLFAVEPGASDTNHLFVAPAGDSANDGLSASQPTTPQAAANALPNYGPELNGTWQINFAAGNHSALALPSGLSTVNNIRLIGVPTGDYVSEPTSIIDKALSGSARNGVYYCGAGMKVLVKDIKCIDFSSAEESAFRGEKHTEGFFQNCHSFNCYYAFYHLDFAFYNVAGGVHDGDASGYYGINELFGVVRNFKYGVTLPSAGAYHTTVKNFTFGMHAKELCTGHLDFVRFEDNDYAVQMSRLCTANPADCDFRRNGVGFHVGAGSKVIDAIDIYWNGQPVTGASWSAGTVTFNFGLDFLSRGVNVAVGERFDITGVNPSGYNGTYTALTATDTQLTAALVSDPGTWVSGGRSNANTIPFLPTDPAVVSNPYGGGNVEDVITAPYVGLTERLLWPSVIPATLTGTTSLTALLYPLRAFRVGMFQAVGYQVRLYAAGTYNIASSATLRFRAGGGTLQNYTLPVGSLAWVMESMFIITATGDIQHHSGTLAVDGKPIQVQRGTRTLPFSTSALDFGVWGQLTNGADSITAEIAMLYTTMS